jgi:hypothetical protein
MWNAGNISTSSPHTPQFRELNFCTFEFSAHKNEQINQTEPTGQNPNTLALMYADMKKLIRYFKLDRHSKNNTDDPNGFPDTPNEERDKLLHEIREDVGGIKQATARKDFTAEQKISLETIKGTVGKALRDFNDTKYGEIKPPLMALNNAVDGLHRYVQKGFE